MEYGYLRYPTISQFDLGEIENKNTIYCHSKNEAKVRAMFMNERVLSQFQDLELVVSELIEPGKFIATGQASIVFNEVWKSAGLKT